MTRARSKDNVAIIGASTSGLYSAMLLARRGFQVTVFERSDELDPVLRTLIVTSRYRDYLGELGERSVVNEIRQFELFSNGHFATVPLAKPDLIIERATLIKDLAKEAERAGVDIRLGHRFKTLKPSEQGIDLALQVEEEQVRYTAKTVIAADGSQSPTARAAGWKQQPVVPLVQAIVPVPADCDRTTSRVWFRPQDSPYFYWLIPETETHGALGLIGEPGLQTRSLLNTFLRQKGFEPLAYQAAKIPCYAKWIDPHKKLGNGNVYLVGDAAGHVKVSTVGGIVTGLRGAKAAADLITDGSRREMRSLRVELGLHLALRRSLHNFTVEDYSSLLAHLNHGVKDSLGSVTRDEMPELVLKLAKAQPQLMLTFVRGVLGGRSFPGPAFASAA